MARHSAGAGPGRDRDTRWIVQNCRRLDTPPYSEQADSLPEALERVWWGPLAKGLDMEGYAAGVIMHLLCGRYDVVVTASHRPQYAFCLMRRLFGRRGARHLAKEIYLEESRGGSAIGPCKRWLKRAASALGRLGLPPDMLLVNASAERRPYGEALCLGEDRVRFVPWPSNLPPEPEPVPGEGYVFSAGRSHRDWPTLIEAARAAGFPLRIVARQRDVAGLEMPSNVVVATDIAHGEYVTLLRGAEVVVLPLSPVERSTGQAALLEAMSLGKPVVASNVLGMQDYLEHGRDGLLVPPGDAAALAVVLDRVLRVPKLRCSLARQALASVSRNHTRQAYSRHLLDCCRELQRT